MKKEKDVYQWYIDSYSDDNCDDLLIEFNKYVPLFTKYINTDCSIFDYNIPNRTKFLKTDEILKYFQLKKLFQ